MMVLVLVSSGPFSHNSVPYTCPYPNIQSFQYGWANTLA